MYTSSASSENNFCTVDVESSTLVSSITEVSSSSSSCVRRHKRSDTTAARAVEDERGRDNAVLGKPDVRLFDFLDKTLTPAVSSIVEFIDSLYGLLCDVTQYCLWNRR